MFERPADNQEKVISFNSLRIIEPIIGGKNSSQFILA